MFIRFARFEAVLVVVLPIANDTVLVCEVNVHPVDCVDVVAVRISVFPRPMIVRVLFEDGSVEKPLDALAVAGALALNFTPSTVSVELPLMLDEPRVPITPVRLAATPPEVRV
jgi:hypothetical protein